MIQFENARAQFFQPQGEDGKYIADGKYHFEFSTELVGHSENQHDLLGLVLNAESRQVHVTVGKAANGHPLIRVYVTADEKEVREAYVKQADEKAKRNDFAGVPLPTPVGPAANETTESDKGADEGDFVI